MQITLAERLESLKAGILGAAGFTSVYLFFVALHYFLAQESYPFISILVKVFVSALSGFLFAVTYRYVIRDDDNPHLKDGAVAAFSLVRGLVPLQWGDGSTMEALLLCLFLGESFICFLLTRWLIDRGFESGFVKPLMPNHL
ncbi:MAG: hypothetical protein N5P05_001681 [Chroococcopsis gigantea SAG 12.99]|jgi:hypothetical protein|nr:hypothetical protein [Chlorogloea purpurea SAG 13.99]MDV3000075.1 hypothetical protein [Chroococcopsis gigantea SAG 12.99]